MNRKTPITGPMIWDLSRVSDPTTRRIELTDLIRFKDNWYCGFHEGPVHVSHPSSRARVIRSSDGKQWETAAVFQWDGADVRELKFSITAEGWLMVNTSLAFVSKQPRYPSQERSADQAYIPQEARSATEPAAKYYQLDRPGTPDSDQEHQVTRQSVTWLSPDGRQWSSAYACPSGVNTWRWETSWHNGMGYSVGYAGKDQRGTLYRTRDGKSWRALLTDFFPDDRAGNEATLAFGGDNTAYCLLRDGQLRDNPPADARDSVVGRFLPILGIGKPPYYTQWQWRELSVDYGPDHGGPRPVEQLFRSPTGGPKLLRLSDDRLILAARMLGPTHDDGRVTLFQVDVDQALLTVLGECDGTSYPGLAEHDGRIWVSYCNSDVSAVHLASVPNDLAAR